jgi:hypothetical protein
VRNIVKKGRVRNIVKRGIEKNGGTTAKPLYKHSKITATTRNQTTVTAL